METHTDIAVVILNWNGKPLLVRFLPSVLEHSSGVNVSVYVADNGSTDGSVQFLKEHYPEVKVIELGQNYGFAEGYNKALSLIDAEVFVLLNTDVEVTSGWLDPCLEILEEDHSVGAVQPKVLSFVQRNHFEYAGASGGFLDRWGFPFCRGRILSVTEEDHGQYDQPASVFWATGACLFIRSGVFLEMGGFDPDFFAHMEEIDLCWRMKNRGWRVMVEPDSVVYHLGGATLSYQSPKKVFLNFRNSLWMLMKNLPEGKLLQVFLPRIALDAIAAVHFLVTGHLCAFCAVLKAHFAFYISLPRFVSKRRKLLPLTKNTRHAEIYRGTMVSNFYLKGRKKFSQYRFGTVSGPENQSFRNL
jgi:GT2 family glycosyltransferase